MQEQRVLDPHRLRRVLLVEDHPDTLMAQAITLRKRGYEVKTAVDATTALAVAASGPLDLVISDVRLPDRSGLELMRELSAQHHLKGIALSGSASEDDVRRGREAGFVKHLMKPVPPERLIEVVEELV